VVNHSKYLISAAMSFGMLLSAAAQTAASTAGIGPSLQARANAGDAAAQVALGEQYAQAAATDHDKVQMAGDYQQELAWYRKAADQNYIPGEMHLAALYRDGGGKTIPRDMEQAALWYRRAADQGDPTAQATLGVLYSMGQGVPHSDVDAYFWLDLAASVKGPNQEKYVANRQMIGERITADELSDVEDRVAAWKAAHPRPDSTN
jgi:TPR repeat protein